MPSIFKNTLKTSLLTSLYNEIKYNNNNYYYYIAKPDTWDDEEVIPTPSNTISNEVATRNNIVFLKKITINDLAFIINRYDWEYGTFFDRYDDKDNTIETKHFYCLTSMNNVYKCIDNNNNGPSTVQPYATSQNIISTSDGYKWKFMYNIPIAMRDKFLTSDFMPVTNAVSNEHYTRGSIYSATVANYGYGYGYNTTLTVSGNGYQKNNKLLITGNILNNKGSGYLYTPDIIVNNPYDAVPFTLNTEYLLGQYVEYNGRIYDVVKAGISSANIYPTHTCLCDDPVSNGTLSLSFVGKPLNGSVILSNDYTINSISFELFVGEIIMSNSGYGYTDATVVISDPPAGTGHVAATGICNVINGRVSSISITNTGIGYNNSEYYVVTISEPFSGYIDFSGNSSISVDDIIKHGYNYYKALADGTLSSVGPTHDIGIVLNGDVNLEYVGQQATANIKLFYGYGYSVDPIITIEPPQLYSISNNNYYTFVERNTAFDPIAVDKHSLIRYSDNYYIVDDDNVTLSNTEEPLHTTGSINNLAFIATIKEFNEAGVDLVIGEFLLVKPEGETNRMYEVMANITNLTSIPTHIDGTTNNLKYIPLILPSITINTEKSAARFTPIIENTQITGVVCNDPGVGYTYATITANESYYGVGANVDIRPDIIYGNSSTKQDYIELSAIPGTIECMRVEVPGVYWTPPTLTVMGDGFECTATPILTGRAITGVTITNPGHDYSYANIIITRDLGDDNTEDAIITPLISPQSGHCKNAITELYTTALGIGTTLSDERINGFTLNNEYRQFGIIKNPLQYSSNLRFNKSIGSGCFTILCQLNSGTLDLSLPITDINNNEYSILGSTITTMPTTHINLLLHPKANSKLVLGQTLYQGPKQLIIISIDYPDINKQTGELLLIDNREAFLPNNEQTVVLKTVINF